MTAPGARRDTRPHAVYRTYDADLNLLYVGCTAKGIARLEQHASSAAWWPEVSFVTVEHVGDRDAALRVEAQAIRNENPKYNRNRIGWAPDEVAAARSVGAALSTSSTAWKVERLGSIVQTGTGEATA